MAFDQRNESTMRLRLEAFDEEERASIVKRGVVQSVAGRGGSESRGYGSKNDR